MSGTIKIIRAGPLVTIQDLGRSGNFSSGISASGPMDHDGFNSGGMLLQTSATSGLEITTAGIAFEFTGTGNRVAFTGGHFTLTLNGKPHAWNCAYTLHNQDRVEISPGIAGNYGYVRFNAECDVPMAIGSRATNMIVGLGGLQGRALQAGDTVKLISQQAQIQGDVPLKTSAPIKSAIRIIWGIHADNFEQKVRTQFVNSEFLVSSKLDRMGVRLSDPTNVFAKSNILSLISDAVVPGDIQILGDGTPIILMRDHQPTGGYPRIATVISADLDRFSQLRPGSAITFNPISIEAAQAI